MRITEISVKKLFGIFDHTIPLNLDDRITIIHGENGFGKTTILNMLYGLFNDHYSELINVPFEKFQVRFDDSSILWIEKDYQSTRQIDLFGNEGIDKTRQSEESRFPKVEVYFSKTDTPEPRIFSLSDSQEFEIPLSYMAKEIPGFGGADMMEYVHGPTGETVSLRDILMRFSPRHPEIPEWWVKLRESVEIHLIPTQRLQSTKKSDEELISYRSSRITPMIATGSKYAEELSRIIRGKLADSASLSQSFDNTFPTRLVRLMGDPNHPKLTNGELETRFDKLDEKRSRLEEIGILDKEDKEVNVVSTTSEEMIGITKDILALYVQDVEKKLSVFDEIADKIGLFKEMIDKRFLYKSIVISKETGFTFVTHDGKALPLTALSSGEQHELVLLYQLLFKTKPNSLVLIDEPEISLHVAWLRVFLQDLQEITRLASFDVLIATHSPDIIQNRWDLTVRLEEPAVL